MNGKGDRYRPVNRQVWDTNWIKIFGKDCPNCRTTGKVRVINEVSTRDNCNVVYYMDNCPFCNGIGRVEK